MIELPQLTTRQWFGLDDLPRTELQRKIFWLEIERRTGMTKDEVIALLDMQNTPRNREAGGASE